MNLRIRARPITILDVVTKMPPLGTNKDYQNPYFEVNALFVRLCLVFFCCQAVCLGEDRLLHQPARPTTNVQAARSYFESDSGFRASDDFRLLGGGEITNVRWQGFLQDGTRAPSPDVGDWVLSFAADVDGRPGETLYEVTVPSADLSTRYSSRATYAGRDVSIYNYSYDLPNGFQAAANEPYWLSVGVGSEERWLWSAGFGDDDEMVRTSIRSGNATGVDFDAHFELYGTRQGTLPASGQAVPDLGIVDDAIQQFLHENTIESAAVGIMRDGEFVYQRGFGWMDEQHQAETPENVMMRLASISKPITAAAINELEDQGLLNWNDAVFDLGQEGGGILKIDPFGPLGDERYKEVTVRDLIRHRGGWDRSISPDYTFLDLQIAQAMGVDSPPGVENKTSYILGQSLDHEPGSTFAYSNVGFMILGMVIEQVTGKEYEDVVYEEVFAPLGVPRGEVEAGRTRPADRNPREPFYDNPDRWMAVDVFDPDGPQVRWPDGGWDHEGSESFGGLVASTKALLTFAENYRLWGDTIGRKRSNNEPSTWVLAHEGSLPGTNTVLLQRGDGTNYVVLLNSRPNGLSQYSTEIANGLFEVLNDPSITWPEALQFAGDGNGDGWVTTDDVDTFSSGLLMSEAAFSETYPDGSFAALDFDANGRVDRHDLPEFYASLQNNDTPTEDRFVVGDLTQDWMMDEADINLLLQALASGTDVDDIDGTPGTSLDDLNVLVKTIYNTWFGDANLDGVFDSSDLVAVFAVGEYEDGIEDNSTWADGDWNGDLDFTSGDIVAAFEDGGYEQGGRAAGAVAVPEPSTALVLTFACLLLALRSRNQQRRD